MEPQMSHDIDLARKAAWNLAKTLMVCVVLFEVEGQFGIVEASEYDGEEATILHEYDPFSR
jgi:hypothetical protein